jgi:hypothetical protein
MTRVRADGLFNNNYEQIAGHFPTKNSSGINIKAFLAVNYVIKPVW